MPIKFENLKKKWVEEWARSDSIEPLEPYLVRKEAAWRKNRQWQDLRSDVWIRDEGICQVCFEPVEDRFYECGHIIDRAMGGEDAMDNLLVMCVACNRCKPLHKTREEFETWRKYGGVHGRITKAMEIVMADKRLAYFIETGQTLETAYREPSDWMLFIGPVV